MNIDSDQPRQTEVLEVELKIRYFIYLVLGAVTCISSSICLIVFLSTNELRKKYVMFSALSVGDFLNGLSFVLAGMFREMALFQGVYFDKMTNRGCLLQTPWNILMIIAGQVPALLHIFVAFDRVAALQFVTIYRKELLIFQKKTYITLTIVLTSTPTAREIRRQRMILSLDLLSVFLVSIPNFAIILNGWKIPKFHPFALDHGYKLRDALRNASSSCRTSDGSCATKSVDRPKPADRSTAGNPHQTFSREGPQIHMGDCGPGRARRSFQRTEPSDRRR
ncbi:unnamed protein product [Haemonchus placei]|uniref:G_PROTEIN_RECEP_F1_2 domain-containing protein n=1 Tax=Haemonchus placei TaxID=6290 RepID=A0A0N4VS79_HAEPC|nr:unnamed protein product [Haemonchus placei]